MISCKNWSCQKYLAGFLSLVTFYPLPEFVQLWWRGKGLKNTAFLWNTVYTAALQDTLFCTCQIVHVYIFLQYCGNLLAGWRRKTWLILCSGKSCSACSALLAHQRVHEWVTPHKSHTPGTSSGWSSQLPWFTREENSDCGWDCMNSDGNVLKLNVYCSLNIIQFTKSVVNPK